MVSKLPEDLLKIGGSRRDPGSVSSRSNHFGIMGFLFLVSCTSEPDNFYLEDAARSSLDQLYIAVDNDRQILDNAAAILVMN